MSSQVPEQSQDQAASSARPRRKRLWIGLAALITLVLLAPTIIALTPLRDVLINAAVADSGLSVSTRSASFGYVAPLSVTGFDLNADDGSLSVRMESLRCEKSWLKMLLSDGDLGTFQFTEPTLGLVTGIASADEEPGEQATAVPTEEPEPAKYPELADEPAPTDEPASTDEPAQEEEPAKEEPAPESATTPANAASDAAPISKLPTLVAEVEKAAVRIRNVSSKDPALDLKDIDFTIRTRQEDFGSVVEIDPSTILDEQPLTPELCSQGIQLVAPMLADAVSVKGNVSFRIEKCTIPVGELEEAERRKLTDIQGAIGLSDVSVGLNNEITKEIVALLANFGGDNDGLRLTVSRSSEIGFHVTDGRVHHEGLMFLLPIGGADFQLQSSGSVGFDETIDLRLIVGLPGSLLGDGPLAKFLTRDPLTIKVTGTVNEPEINLGEGEA